MFASMSTIPVDIDEDIEYILTSITKSLQFDAIFIGDFYGCIWPILSVDFLSEHPQLHSNT